MLLSGLRSAEVLGLRVNDVDIARRWVRVFGKGGKERSVPIDTDVAGGAIQTYLLAERPETDAEALFVVAKRRPPRTATYPRRDCARCSAITASAPVSQPGTPTRYGIHSAPRWPRQGGSICR